jgi:Uma2 family endonuclease
LRLIHQHFLVRLASLFYHLQQVQTVETGAFFYPDVLISCDPRDKTASKFVCFPCLIAEILSPSTEAYDRVAKFAQYRRLESLREYVLISSEKISVDIFRLNDSQKWELTPYAAGEIVQFTSIDFECPIELLYEDVELLPPENGYGRIG